MPGGYVGVPLRELAQPSRRLKAVGEFLPEDQGDAHSNKNEGIPLVCLTSLGHSQDRTRRGTCGRDQPPHTMHLFS